MNVNSNYSAVLSMRIFQSYNTMVIPINNFRCHDMTDQEEARGFLDSVSEAGSDESEPLIPPSVPPSSRKSPLARHVFAGLSFLGFANVYAMRVNLSVAIVYMSEEKSMDWDESKQGFILGDFD